ncbi:hypothetical protein [Streptomyces sp. PT12]|nr:hypothetical protein [Streptomyces sp. PT12]
MRVGVDAAPCALVAPVLPLPVKYTFGASAVSRLGSPAAVRSISGAWAR